jgi:hypothetical protein
VSPEECTDWGSHAAERRRYPAIDPPGVPSLASSLRVSSASAAATITLHTAAATPDSAAWLAAPSSHPVATAFAYRAYLRDRPVGNTRRRLDMLADPAPRSIGASACRVGKARKVIPTPVAASCATAASATTDSGHTDQTERAHAGLHPRLGVVHYLRHPVLVSLSLTRLPACPETPQLQRHVANLIGHELWGMTGTQRSSIAYNDPSQTGFRTWALACVIGKEAVLEHLPKPLQVVGCGDVQAPAVSRPPVMRPPNIPP